MALRARPKNVLFMICCEVFSALCSPSPIPLLDDFGALLVKELVAAVRAQELDFLVPKFLIVAIKFAFALRAGHPKYLRHVCLSLLHHEDAEFAEIGVFLLCVLGGSAGIILRFCPHHPPG
jgi:hypothetical protein